MEKEIKTMHYAETYICPNIVKSSSENETKITIGERAKASGNKTVRLSSQANPTTPYIHQNYQRKLHISSTKTHKEAEI